SEIIAVLGIGCTLLVPLLPALQSARDSPSHVLSQYKLKQIALALHAYHDEFGSFPPPYIADESGRPKHTWRVLLLPYLDYESLYERYDFAEPWDGPNNRNLHNIHVKAFEYPRGYSRPRTNTAYVAVVGPQTLWPQSGRSISMADVKDGLASTI